MMGLRQLGICLVAAVVLAGCGEAATCPVPRPEFDSCGSGLFVEFDPFEENNTLFPFPDPLRTTSQPFKSGTTGYQPKYGGEYGPLLNTLDGFGVYAPVIVQMNELIHPVFLPHTPEESLDPESPVFIVDYEAIRAAGTGAPFAAVVHPVTAWYNREIAGAPVNKLIIAPWEPLQPKHEYAVVITDRLRSWTAAPRMGPERCVGASEAFQCAKSGSEVDPQIEPMRAGLQPLFVWLESLGIERGEVSLAMHFTTESIEDELLDVRRQVDQALPPKPRIDPDRVFLDVSDPVTGKLKQEVKDYFQELFPEDEDVDVDFDDYEFDAMGTIAYGTFLAKDFQHPEFRIFITDGVTGRVKQQGVNELEFMVVLPKADPANGIGPPYKTVVFQHALTVCKESMVAIANEFNRRGLAMVGIDVVRHGSRSEESLLGERNCVIQGLDFLLPPEGPLAGREGFRQTIADQFQLVNMLKAEGFEIDVDGTPGNDLEVSRLAYVSQSLGSIIGATFLALEPDVGAGVLNVGGGGLYSVALSFFGDEDGQPVGPDGFAELPDFLLELMLVLQSGMERADPINYAKFIARAPLNEDGIQNPPKSILLQEAIGDSVVGNFSTDSLTREMGGELAGPTFFRDVPGLAIRNAPFSGNAAGGQATIAMTQFDPAGHSFLLTLDDPGAFCRGQIQAAEFARSFLEDGDAVVIDAYTDASTAACP